MEKEYPIQSDSRQTVPTFDEMVGLIKKLFTDYLEDVIKSKPSEIEKSWERYKCLNHLYQDEAASTPTGAVWVKGNLPTNPGEYYCKCKIDGEEKRLIVGFDRNGKWGEATGYDYYEDFEIIEWLDESPGEKEVKP